MLLRRRRPTLEVHVPVSPTPTFLNMAHYLTLSLRKRGGRHRDAPVVLTVGGEERVPELERDHPWLSKLGVEVRWVDPALFARESWWGTACERMRHDFRSDVVLQLDADTLIAGPLDELVTEAHDRQAVCGVIAHLPPLASMETWRRIYERCGISELETPCEHTGWGYLFDDETLRYCPPYFNLGVLAAPAGLTRRIGEVVYELMAQVDAVERTAYRVQIAVSLAVTKLGIPYRELPFRWNFVNDPLLEALHASELPHVRIIHLLRRHQLRKDRMYLSRESVEATLARRDLRVVNAMARQLLAELHPLALEHAAPERGS
jgi:hypothetical protein